MPNNLGLISSTAVSAIAAVLISKSAIKNGSFQCENYVTNTFLYLILTISILALTFFSLEKNPSITNKIPLLATFLISIGCLIGMIYTSTDQLTLKHIFWLGFIMSIGYALYPSFKSMIHRNTFRNALITVIIITACVAIFVRIYPNSNLTNNWGKYLIWILLAVIVFQLVMIFTGSFTKERWNLMASFIIVLFTCFLLSDIQNVIRRAKLCSTGSSALVKPDYILESSNIFLDLLNIFVYSDRL